jgi:hypothetical protein
MEEHMTQDEIIEMAIKSHLVMSDYDHPTLAAFAKLVEEKAFEQGFYAGFKASGEGWNGEFPFRDKNLDIQQDESVQHELKEAIRARGQA